MVEDSIFTQLSSEFFKHGHVITRISYGDDLLFWVKPFTESFLGWIEPTLSHFTIFDDLPLADLTKQDILSDGEKLQHVVSLAIDEVHKEEIRMKMLLDKTGVTATPAVPMVW
jgi:hypothetical protein